MIFVSELKFYLSTETVDRLYVNTTWKDKLKVSFDISFPEISCSLISLDAIDDTGLPQKGTSSEIYKHKLWNGEKQGIPELHILGDSIRSEKQLMSVLPPEDITSLPDEVECGNCYGAGSEEDCCDTCEDVRLAYEKRGWHFQPQEVKQCEKQVKLDNWKDENADDGGCQLYGVLELNRASGHFHIAPHKKLQKVGEAVGIIDFLELISFTFSQFNITHTINSLRFGDQYPGIKSPLDGITRTLEDTHGMYQYYLKIVPTVYSDKKAKNLSIESNQYAVTEHMRHLAPGNVLILLPFIFVSFLLIDCLLILRFGKRASRFILLL